MQCKFHWIVLYTVHATAFSLGGGRFFPDTVYCNSCMQISVTTNLRYKSPIAFSICTTLLVESALCLFPSTSSVHSPPGSPHLAHITQSQTHSPCFHFHRSLTASLGRFTPDFPSVLEIISSQVFLSHLYCLHGSSWTRTEGHWRLFVSVSSSIYDILFLVTC